MINVTKETSRASWFIEIPQAVKTPPDLNYLEGIINRMLPIIQDENTGGFRVGLQNDRATAFTTIEGIFPLLLFPKNEKLLARIVKGIKYILDQAEQNNNRISPDPEYKGIRDNCCVDSMAYGLYVLTLARKYFKYNLKGNWRHESLKDIDLNALIIKIDKQISECVIYLKNSMNYSDGGWALLKDSQLKSRTYSTALTVFSLSNCDNRDFPKGEFDKGYLIKSGVKFLIENNRSKDKGWFYSLAVDSDLDDVKIKKTTPSVNLTATVVFSLCHILRTEWRNELINNGRVECEEAIREGCDFIVKNGYQKDKWVLDKDYELVDFITDNGARLIRGIEAKEHGWAHPYEMILPALVLSPGYSIASKEIMMLGKYIKDYLDISSASYKTPCEVYDFSDKIFSLLYLYYIRAVIEGSIDQFVKQGDCVRCIIDGVENCRHIRSAMKSIELMNEENKQLKNDLAIMIKSPFFQIRRFGLEVKNCYYFISRSLKIGIAVIIILIIIVNYFAKVVTISDWLSILGILVSILFAVLQDLDKLIDKAKSKG